MGMTDEHMYSVVASLESLKASNEGLSFSLALKAMNIRK